jgi:predicted nucleic acid-binding protein
MKGRLKPWAYFDTSVLVKRYVQENGSDQAKTLLNKHRFLSSRLALVEAASTFRRRRDSQDLDARHFAAILKRFDADREHLELIEPTREVLERAEKLVRERKIRSLDAIHIASTLCFKDSTNARIPFITGDGDQRQAATDLSLEVIWVG